MKKIRIFVPPNAIGLSVSLIKDLCWVGFSYAAEIGGWDADPKDHVQLVSTDGKAISLFSGNEISADLALKEATESDAIFICAFWGSYDPDHYPGIQSWLKRNHKRGIPIAAVSNAPFFLADAGLLEKKVATVYPPTAKAFRTAFPQVDLRDQRAITNAKNLYCANGIASGCDLIVAIIELVFGPEVARRIRKEFLLGFNRGYFLSNVSFDGQKYHKDQQILLAQQWLETHFRQQINLSTVAADVGMSMRNFTRRFQNATGESPTQYLQRVRIEAAKDMLRHKSISISEVAFEVGYSDLSHFSQIFSRYEGCLPHQFRADQH